MIKTSAQIISLSIALAAFAAPALSQEISLSAHMMGSSEKPAAGDPDGMGHATVKVDLAKSQVCYSVMVENIAPATMAHIHKAGTEAAGPVAVPLNKPGVDGKVSGCAAVAPDLAKDMTANPAGYYVNVHNAEFGAGAIRGQLSK